MARKSAHGNAICQFSKTTENVDSLTIRERVTYAFFPDGVILKKWDVWFKPGPYDNGKPRFHSYNWKIQSRGTIERFQILYSQLTEKNYIKDLGI